MIGYRWILLTLMLISLPLQASGDDLDSITREVYQQTGLSSSQVPFEHFEAAYHRYLQGTRTEHFNKPLISFVNFTLQSGMERFFLVDVSTGGARIVYSTYVSHGLNTGPATTARYFGNVPESYKSSLGFFKVAEEYQGNNGRSIRIDGLSGELNSNARRRLVVLHSGNYVSVAWVRQNGFAGRSLGCFVVPFSVRDSIFNAIVGGTLLYAFYGSQGAEYNGPTTGLYEVARNNTEGSGANVTPGAAPPMLSDHPNFADANPSMASQGLANDHMNLTPGTGIDGPSSLDYDGDGEPDNFEEDNPQINSDGGAPLTGNSAYERCQSYADRPWSEVVTRTQNGEDPYKFFRGSWLDLERKSASGDDITYSAGSHAAKNHAGVINECVAMAVVADRNNFEREDPNAPSVTRSRDGEIECQYLNSEVVDNTQCEEIVEVYDGINRERAELHQGQGKDFSESGSEKVAGVQNGINIQGNSAIVAADLANSVDQMAAERQQFETASLGVLAGQLAAMPNYKSLLAKCRAGMSKYPNGSLPDYKAFMTTIPDGSFPVPDMGDACVRALGRLNVKYIQNKKAKDQTMKALEKLGYNIDELESQQSELKRQRDAIRDSGMKGPSIPDYLLPDLKKHQGPGDRPDDLEQMGMDSFFGPKSRSSSSTNFLYPKASATFREISSLRGAVSRKQGLSQGIITFDQVDNAQKLRENTKMFFSLLKEGQVAKLIPFMQKNGLTLSDLEYAFKKGAITKAQYQRLVKELSGRLGQVTRRRNVDYEVANGKKNNTWQIEKDSGKSLFDIISNRYFKQTHLTSE